MMEIGIEFREVARTKTVHAFDEIIMIEAEHPEICDADEEEAKFVRKRTAFRLELLQEKSNLAEPVKTTQSERD